MYKCKYPNLFSPITLGDVLFRNRIFASPTGVFYADPLHRPLYETMCYYERKAKGGAASVCVGDATVDGAHGAHGAYSILMEDEGLAPALNKLAMTINRHGAVATLEMFHAGSAASVSYHAGNEIYGPQDEEVAGALGQPPVRVRAMTRDIMNTVIDKHVAGALKAKACGFGMVTLHFAHGFLMHQFMSPTLNHRTDEYGGSFENRMRLPLETLRAVRTAVGPKFPIEVRISGSEVYDGGYDVDYGCRIAAELDGIADLIHVSAGSHEDARVFTVTHPSMFLEDGVNVKYAAEIKKRVKYSKVATVGALSDPEMLQEIIASGKADVVEMARGLICDPDLPDKARDGRADEITRCVRCFTCFSTLLTHGHIVCALNPEIADEAEHKFARPPAKPLRVLVAGGGVAGMEAAAVCAARGHEVTLCEKSERLGGVLRCEDGVPFKRHLREYLDRQAARVRKSGVRVMLNTPVTKALAEEIAPDAVIAAIGAAPASLKIPGGESALVAEDVYISPERAGRRVVILGGGLVGCELAIYLGKLGRDVTVLEMMQRPNFGDNILHGQAVGIELERAGVKLRFDVKADEITRNGVWGVSESERTFFECDAVISAVGLLPRRAEADELRFTASYFYQIGDCLASKNIYEATRAAHQIALDIGER
ncbi:MAG: NAD(P)/FAD-dependent oxidoreductase [Oscillospiraceae bacterium]|jgi:2,4-dienoyl-CoA reductase-like NADH-dependent reductase (Old Yellow Enzyme family)/NADPH-dependent 2,4-dienoyl-CoA reductase/sulfur reductase-like enzyme|nr:NAD(P)/FAD-dependent oxidoreductase [Oscillospiraceae bacterium]